MIWVNRPDMLRYIEIWGEGQVLGLAEEDSDLRV